MIEEAIELRVSTSSIVITGGNQGDDREDRRQQPVPGWASQVSTGHWILREH
jgi:hypothetical protein